MDGRAVNTQAMDELNGSVHYTQTHQCHVVRHKSNIQRHIDTDWRGVYAQKAFKDTRQKAHVMTEHIRSLKKVGWVRRWDESCRVVSNMHMKDSKWKTGFTFQFQLRFLKVHSDFFIIDFFYSMKSLISNNVCNQLADTLNEIYHNVQPLCFILWAETVWNSSEGLRFNKNCCWKTTYGINYQIYMIFFYIAGLCLLFFCIPSLQSKGFWFASKIKSRCP